MIKTYIPPYKETSLFYRHKYTARNVKTELCPLSAAFKYLWFKFVKFNFYRIS